MNIPFPALFPRMVDPNWFNADRPCDEDAELNTLEEAHRCWLSSIVRQHTIRATHVITNHEKIEAEAESNGEGNELDESEESHDQDEELRYTPPSSAGNNNDLAQDSHDDHSDPSD